MDANIQGREVGPGGSSVQERRDNRPVYVISVAAEITGLHPRTLRIYEMKGLLAPVRRNRIRLYSDHDIERVRVIRRLIEAHRLNLAGVRLILEVVERLEYGSSKRVDNTVQWLVERILDHQGGRKR